MEIAIIGATGNVGSRLVNEALNRGHFVTGVSRHASSQIVRPDLKWVEANASHSVELASAIANHDAVVSSVGFRQVRPSDLITAVRRSGVKRYLVVGGAGSLQNAEGGMHVDSPHFPAAYRDEALGGKEFLDALKEVEDVEWTMLSPSAVFTAGERTGKFRLGDDTLLVGADGKSWISYEDFAIALLDEIEMPRHIRRRFTIGY